MKKFTFIVEKSKSSKFAELLIDGALDFSFTGNNFADIFTVDSWFNPENITDDFSADFILQVFNLQMLENGAKYCINTNLIDGVKNLFIMHGYDNAELSEISMKDLLDSTATNC
jgi:hypothetical protein